MRLREVIALLGGLAAGWPQAARAQQNGTSLRIGMVEPISAELNAANLALLWQIGIESLCETSFTLRTSQERRPCEEVENGLSDGRHAGLRWWPPGSFFSAPSP